MQSYNQSIGFIYAIKSTKICHKILCNKKKKICNKYALQKNVYNNIIRTSVRITFKPFISYISMREIHNIIYCLSINKLKIKPLIPTAFRFYIHILNGTINRQLQIVYDIGI